jgi:hypothetical protein
MHRLQRVRMMAKTGKDKEAKKKTEECFTFSGAKVCKVCKCTEDKCECEMHEKG